MRPPSMFKGFSQYIWGGGAHCVLEVTAAYFKGYQ